LGEETGIMMRIKIKGTGSAVPKLKVTNDDISKIVDTSDEWIKSRTGIEARHLAVEETTSSLSVEAAAKALKDARITAEEVDLIIAATVTPDRFFPNLSCEVQSALGADNAVAFDISAACSGFLFGMATAKLYLESGNYKNALIIGAETLSKIVDWNDRSTCVLFGDGAGAAVLSAEEAVEESTGEQTEKAMQESTREQTEKAMQESTREQTDEIMQESTREQVDTEVSSGTEVGKSGRGILSIVQGSDGAKGMALNCSNRPVNNPYVKNDTALAYTFMNGQEVYKFAVRTVPKVINEALEKAGLQAEDIDVFLLHQANIRIIEAVAKRLGQPLDKFPTNLQEYGNISAASIPILLDNVKNYGMISKGSKMVLSGFGAGLTWGAAVVEW
jgi:3-oxoacyl-[acyl-carrier-protein] synthase-3